MKRSSPKSRRLCRWGIVLAILVVAVASFPTLWGPALVASIIRSKISVPELGGSLDSVDCVSLRTFSMRGLRFAAIPGEPVLGSVVASYSPVRLLRENRIDSLDATDFRMDLSDLIKPPAADLFTNRTVEASLHVSAADDGPDMVARLEGTLLDWKLTGDGAFAVTRTNGFRLAGSTVARIPDSDWRATADFNATADGWDVVANLPETRFDETDPVLGSIAARAPKPGVEKLSFGGLVSGLASARMTKDVPVPVWAAKVRLSDAEASADASGQSVVAKGLRTTVSVSGIASHWDLAPMYPRMDSLTVGDFAFTDASVSMRATERSILVTEGQVGFCGGTIRVYALFLDPEKLSTGFTLFLDGIDTGEFLTGIPDFRGQASGHLYGKIPMYLRNGKELHFRDAFLYSPPGETGKLRIEDPKPVTDMLAASGVDGATCENLASALADLDYSVLRFDLVHDGPDESALRVQLQGTATKNAKTVPVDLSVSFHGEIERLVNFGIRAASGPVHP